MPACTQIPRLTCGNTPRSVRSITVRLRPSLTTRGHAWSRATSAVAALEQDLAAAESEAEAVASERGAALAELERLRLKFDDEIRGELQTAFDAEADRACTAAKDDIDASISGLVNYDEDWAPIGSRSDLIATVEDCAAAERAKTAEQREADRLASCATIDVDAVVKDPDAFTGQCQVMYVAIWQYDSRTGRCSFLGAVSDRSHRFRFDYGDDAAFAAESETSCPELDGIDADDHIKVWATGLGPFSYDTAIGGTNEIPLWRIEKVELVRQE